MMNQRTSPLTRLASRIATLVALFGFFSQRGRRFLAPVLVFVLVAGLLLLVTGGLSYVAPFVYSVF
ncbi:DUF5989 family protein [Sorangium sp. So ce1182]|uniref:DUF5989 family protein n=1 Tax=Sorangium sp. So ce1182 TaxID=3133334 RepID=UPI003F63A520